MSQKTNSNLVRLFVIAGAILVLVAGFIAFERYSDTLSVGKVEYERREVAKPFDLPVIGKSETLQTGDRLSLSEAKGKAVLLHFWASWCEVCREEKPAIDEFWAKHRDSDIVVIGVASFDTKQAMLDSKLIEKPSFTVVLDEDGAVATAYKVPALPVTVLIDKDGYIVRTFKGVMKPYDLAAVENYLQSIDKAH